MLTAPAGSWCAKTGKACRGTVMVMSPSPAEPGGGSQGADSAGPGVAPCPCRLLFPFGLEVPSWWDLGKLPHSKAMEGGPMQAEPEYQSFAHPAAFECIAGWRTWAEPSVVPACRAVAQVLALAPGRQVVPSARELYGLGQALLTEVQQEVFQSQRWISARCGVRQSRDHVLIAGDEIQGHAVELCRVPNRLGVLALPGDEVSFLASSSTRRARFCRWLRQLEAGSNPLAVVSGVPLMAPAAAEPRAPQGARLAFRAPRRAASAPAPLTDLLRVFEVVDQDVLLMLLAEGAQRIQSWRRGGPGGASEKGPSGHKVQVMA